jgi:hypothetical protein
MTMAARKSVRWDAPPRRAALLRKTSQGRKGVERQISLGGLNNHLGYFIRRAQVWVFQDFIRTSRPLISARHNIRFCWSSLLIQGFRSLNLHGHSRSSEQGWYACCTGSTSEV